MKRLVLIAGVTCTGKSSLALSLANGWVYLPAQIVIWLGWKKNTTQIVDEISSIIKTRSADFNTLGYKRRRPLSNFYLLLKQCDKQEYDKSIPEKIFQLMFRFTDKIVCEGEILNRPKVHVNFEFGSTVRIERYLIVDDPEVLKRRLDEKRSIGKKVFQKTSEEFEDMQKKVVNRFVVSFSSSVLIGDRDVIGDVIRGKL